MNFFSILTLLGGLAMFLYGMQVMGDGLAKVSGGKLEQILENLTSSKWKAVLLGMCVTAVIQSSSATTVMVVGFVNSGIMKLTQAVGIIMGANIGTTITSWILSLTGIESSNFFISLLKPSSFSPILAMVGIILLTFTKSSRKKDIGTIMLGFAVLMFGMESMSGAVKPLADVPEFTGPSSEIFQPGCRYPCRYDPDRDYPVFICICRYPAGTLYDWRSTVQFCIPDHHGTEYRYLCDSDFLSAIGANKNAKRAAMIHLYFNLIGTVVFMILFYMINAAVHFPFMTQMATPATIAITHSVFNITATLVWLPFSNLLVKLACLTICDDKKDEVSKEDQEFMILESRFLEKPAFAVEQGRNAARHMEKDSRKALNIALDLIYDYSEEQAEHVQEIESKVDRYEDELGTYLVKLNNKNLSERDSHSVSTMLHCIGDFERISDHAVNIMESAQELHEKKLTFSAQARNELQVLIAAVSRIVDTAYQIFDKQDLNLTEDVEPLEEIVDELSKELKRRHINRLRSGECTIEMGFILTDLLTSLERIADHCSNISVCITQVRENLYDTHSHLESLKNEPDDAYL